MLAGDLHQLPQARRACATLTEQWQAIDGLIVNAGTCDYLPLPITQTLLQDVVRSNLAAASHCLEGALPFWTRGAPRRWWGFSVRTLPCSWASPASRGALPTASCHCSKTPAPAGRTRHRPDHRGPSDTCTGHEHTHCHPG
ncbi:hypothetical protein NWF32_01650 [Pseudomonas qingdaonensis]|nr:hypothetical protein [Pseudomonas qingdaonensis]